MPLPHFGYHIEPIFSSLFELYTSIDEKEILKYYLTEIDNDKITFSSFDKTFEIINKHIGKIIDVKINVHDKEGKPIFYLKFNNFKFIGYLNFLNYSNNTNDIKQLEVKYDFTDIQYISNKSLKQLRINKINDIFDVKNNDYIIKKEFLL
jgi:hypothetical protein